MNASATIQAAPDAVNPPHYKQHPSGVECIAIVRHMNFNLGNAVKYIWRAGLKSEDPAEDLRKARWYLDDEIAQGEGRAGGLTAKIAPLDQARAHIASLETINAGQRETIERLRRELAASEERRLATGALLLKAEETLRAVGPSVMSIAAERLEQIERERFTPEHDAEHHADGSLAVAAACYAWHAGLDDQTRAAFVGPRSSWPWADQWWKPKSRQRDLVRAGALIAAELDRLTGYRAERRPAAAPVTDEGEHAVCQGCGAKIRTGEMQCCPQPSADALIAADAARA